MYLLQSREKDIVPTEGRTLRYIYKQCYAKYRHHITINTIQADMSPLWEDEIVHTYVTGSEKRGYLRAICTIEIQTK